MPLPSKREASLNVNPASVLRNKELHKEAQEESLIRGGGGHGLSRFKLGPFELLISPPRVRGMIRAHLTLIVPNQAATNGQSMHSGIAAKDTLGESPSRIVNCDV